MGLSFGVPGRMIGRSGTMRRRPFVCVCPRSALARTDRAGPRRERGHQPPKRTADGARPLRGASAHRALQVQAEKMRGCGPISVACEHEGAWGRSVGTGVGRGGTPVTARNSWTEVQGSEWARGGNSATDLRPALGTRAGQSGGVEARAARMQSLTPVPRCRVVAWTSKRANTFNPSTPPAPSFLTPSLAVPARTRFFFFPLWRHEYPTWRSCELRSG